MRRVWAVVLGYWAVVALIGYVAAAVTWYALLGLPVAMVAMGAMLAWASGKPAPTGPVVRDEAKW